MATRYRIFKQGTTPNAPFHNLARGLRMGKEYPLRNVANAQDTVVSHGLRVLLREGLRMQAAFSEPNGVDPAIADYPDKSPREIARARARLTPGNFLAWTVLALPSGLVEDGGDTEAFGEFQLEITWDGPVATVVTTHTLSPTLSPYTFGGEPSFPAKNFDRLERLRELDLYPEDGTDSDLDILKKWSQNVDVTLKLSYAGGCRPVDICVFERPFAFAGDTSTDDFPTPCHTSGGQAKALLESPFPVEDIGGAADPTQGAKQVLESALLQAAIGPAFFSIGAHIEGTTPVTNSAPAPWVRAATTFAEPRFSAVLGPLPLDNRPGSSGSAAATAQLVRFAAPLDLRDLNGAVPVRVHVYAMGEGFVRVVSENYSVAEVEVNAVAFEWASATGVLRCGVVADEPSVFELRFAATGGNDIELLYVAVEFEE